MANLMGLDRSVPVSGSARAQLAFMECRNPACKGEGNWFNDSGNREWFVYEGDAPSAYQCPVCEHMGTRYPY